ncbi:hypothetical protein [Criblamydia sequanensis]|uniref:Uncharacterized protein n=1 Tax=Candidatus Criblamydia sequanensis CRIB-18 TaxID=1437425 RepID=A0A090CZ60_9BACT|nr:hypothetical protein [Criblamydia sequanensis]CDR34031.1 hypothetical protein CSEC_1208 [Criblamydia sequanensis CRIB-18]
MRVDELNLKSTDSVNNGAYLVELKVGKATLNSAEKTNSVFAMIVVPISEDVKSSEKQGLYNEIAKNEGFAVANFENGILKSVEMTQKMYDIAISGAVEEIFIKSGSGYKPLTQNVDPIVLKDEDVKLLDSAIRTQWHLKKQDKKKGNCVIS